VWGKFIVTGRARRWGWRFPRFELGRQLGIVGRQFGIVGRELGSDQRVVERRLR
jgi:hypothetical protein